MADRRFREVHLRLTVYEDTYNRIEAYANLHNLPLDLALSDLIGFGLHGEGIFLDDPSDEETPPATPVTQLGPQEPPDDPMIYNRRQADGTFRSLAGFWERDDAPLAE